MGERLSMLLEWREGREAEFRALDLATGKVRWCYDRRECEAWLREQCRLRGPDYGVLTEKEKAKRKKKRA